MQPLLEASHKAASFLKGIASEHRLAILCVLGEGELSVGSIQEKTGIAQTSLSQHLAKLKKEGIIDCRREHRTLYYFVTHDTAKEILGALRNAFCPARKD